MQNTFDPQQFMKKFLSFGGLGNDWTMLQRHVWVSLSPCINHPTSTDLCRTVALKATFVDGAAIEENQAHDIHLSSETGDGQFIRSTKKTTSHVMRLNFSKGSAIVREFRGLFQGNHVKSRWVKYDPLCLNMFFLQTRTHSLGFYS